MLQLSCSPEPEICQSIAALSSKSRPRGGFWMCFPVLSRSKNILFLIITTHPRRYFSIIRNRSLKFLLYFFDNSPYISGDSIAALTDYYVYGRSSKKRLNKRRLASCSSVSIKGERFHALLDELMEFPNLRTIVTCNSDENFLNPVDLPRDVTLWLCQNNAVSGESRIHTLPIGIENLRLARSGFKKLHRPQSSFEIRDKVLVPPMSPTNEIRSQILKELKIHFSSFDVKSDYLKTHEYFRLTRKYQFILALEGNGFENHRVWEALYQNSFPVMLRSKWSLSLAEMRLPIMYIDSLADVTSESLRSFSDSHRDFKAINHEVLWTPYWKELINTGVYREPNPGYEVH
jgi:hypothetical protein